MKVEIGEQNCLLVFLEKSEVSALHLESESCSYSDPACRSVLGALYRDAALRVGFVPERFASRTIELLPFQDGSMLLCFRFEVKRQRFKVRARRRQSLCLYEFSGVEELAAFCERIGEADQLPQGVYECEGAYRFVLSSHAQRLENLLKEYAHRVTEPLAIAATREYWREVYSESAESAAP